jgi:hypothetical protein
MKQPKLGSRRSNLLFGGFLLIAVVALIISSWLVLSSQSILSGNSLAIATLTPLFSDLPPAKRTIAIRIETTRAAALKETPSTLITKVIPASPTPFPTQVSAVSQRSAGAGVIVESGQAPFPANYVFINQWYEKVNDRVIRVYAGAQRSDPSQGGKYLDKPWPGLVIVVVSTSDYKAYFPNEGGQYFTPVKSGAVSILDAIGERLVLSSENSTTFYFDVPTRQFISSLTGVAPTVTSTPQPTPTQRLLYP